MCHSQWCRISGFVLANYVFFYVVWWFSSKNLNKTFGLLFTWNSLGRLLWGSLRSTLAGKTVRMRKNNLVKNLKRSMTGRDFCQNLLSGCLDFDLPETLWEGCSGKLPFFGVNFVVVKWCNTHTQYACQLFLHFIFIPNKNRHLFKNRHPKKWQFK